MGQGGEEEEGITRFAIPLTAGAIVTAQVIMAVVTHVAGSCTEQGWGRKPLFLIGIASLPIRCALIIFLKDAGHKYLLFTQVFDGIGGGLFGLIHPYIVADITFGTGRFNAVSKSVPWCLALEATRRRRRRLLLLLLPIPPAMHSPGFPSIFLSFFFHSGPDGVSLRSGCDPVELSGATGRPALRLRDQSDGILSDIPRPDHLVRRVHARNHGQTRRGRTTTTTTTTTQICFIGCLTDRSKRLCDCECAQPLLRLGLRNEINSGVNFEPRECTCLPGLPGPFRVCT